MTTKNLDIKPDPKKLFLDLWTRMIECGSVVELKSGHELFYQGHEPYGVYVVLSGEVEFVRKSRSNKNISFKAPLHIPIGLDLLLENEVYPFSAVAKSDCTLFFISKSYLPL